MTCWSRLSVVGRWVEERQNSGLKTNFATASDCYVSGEAVDSKVGHWKAQFCDLKSTVDDEDVDEAIDEVMSFGLTVEASAWKNMALDGTRFLLDISGTG